MTVQLVIDNQKLDASNGKTFQRVDPLSAATVSVGAACSVEDAIRAGIVVPDDLPDAIVDVCGRTRRQQLNTFVRAVVRAVEEHGEVGMPPNEAAALAALRTFNYERIYVRPASLAQSQAVIDVLRALVEYYIDRPDLMPDGREIPAQSNAAVRAAVTYVAGMTYRYAFDMAVRHLSWPPERLPRGIDRDA